MSTVAKFLILFVLSVAHCAPSKRHTDRGLCLGTTTHEVLQYSYPNRTQSGNETKDAVVCDLYAAHKTAERLMLNRTSLSDKVDAECKLIYNFLGHPEEYTCFPNASLNASPKHLLESLCFYEFTIPPSFPSPVQDEASSQLYVYPNVLSSARKILRDVARSKCPSLFITF